VRLDSTRFKLMRDNPERYRLYQSLGYRAKGISPAIALGSAGHEFMDADARGKDFSQVARELKEQPGFTNEIIAQAEVLARTLIDEYPAGGHVLLSEREFCKGIEGSPHQITGKIDRITGFSCPSSEFPKREKEDHFKVLDWKFKGNSGYRSLYEGEKKIDVQAGFYLLGARTWGYETKDFTYVTCVKSSPIEIWKTPVDPETWTDYKLSLLERSIHIVCETILMYERTFGISEPWPHSTQCFPCNKDQRWCEFRDICQQVHQQQVLPEGFEHREDHLEVMRENNNHQKAL
jgi:hypothetical protein